MSTVRLCKACGAPLPVDAPEGLCPQCLMKHGLEEAATLTAGSGAAEHRTSNSQHPTSNLGQPDGCDGSASEPRTTDHGPRTTLRYFGDYELLEEIARGGMGVVYKARQVSLNRIVAVKMILAGNLASEAEVKRFHTEAEAAANLQHPNIVAIHEVGVHEGLHYFSMDYVEGQNLAQVVKAGPLPAARAAQLVKTIAEAIQYAHLRGVFHRDLKPQNVMVDPAGRPRVTDFGLAKRRDSREGLTLSGAVMGSPSYMSPEQAQGKQELVGPPSDLYSLGAILYELLTGRPPFRGETPLATLAQVVGEEPAAPRSLNPSVPQDLESVCLKCLEKQPERRYPSARELVADLERFLNQEPVLARPASVWRKGWSWSRRHPWAIVLGLTTLLIVLLGVVFWLETENEFLKYQSAHSRYVPGGPAFKRLMPVFRSLAHSLLFAFSGSGLWYLVAAFNQKRGLEKSKAIRFLRNPAVAAFLPFWVVAGIFIVHGVSILQRAIEAHVWDGESLIISSSMGFALLYIGIWLAVEFLIVYRRAELLRGGYNPFADLHAGFADLKRGDFRTFWRKQLARNDFYAAGLSPDWIAGAQPHWRATGPRVLTFVAMCGLAAWGGKALGTALGTETGTNPIRALVLNETLFEFVYFVMLGVFFNAVYWAMKGGLVSLTRATMWAVLLFLAPIMIGIMKYIAFTGLGGWGVRSMVLQGLLGLVLGLAASFQLVRWKKVGQP